MNLADRGLNTQAQALEEATTKIRLLIRDGYLQGRPKAAINVDLQKIIRDALRDVRVPALRDAAVRSLNAFAERQYNTYIQAFGFDPKLLLAVLLLNGEKQGVTPQNVAAAESVVQSEISWESPEMGVPAQIYSRDYFKQRIEPVFERILRQKSLDPDDVSGSNTLRNRAEMEVRYDDHLRQIEDLRNDGVKLVISSVHADCSDRCYPWQGRVYSLDGTSGKTSDGISYMPLERATDIYYTTKAGITYKNGLLGFNCRHYLMPYKSGMVVPYVSKDTQQKQSKINTKQRELERVVRGFREDALFYKNLNREKYLEARRNAIAANKEYIKFSQDNGRAYYPSRVELL